jgi:hypothetical protein
MPADTEKGPAGSGGRREGAAGDSAGGALEAAWSDEIREALSNLETMLGRNSTDAGSELKRLGQLLPGHLRRAYVDPIYVTLRHFGFRQAMAQTAELSRAVKEYYGRS